jgi:hypothetical protein
VFSEQRSLSYERRHFEQAPRVDRPQPALCSTTPSFLPATQGQRSTRRRRPIAKHPRSMPLSVLTPRPARPTRRRCAICLRSVSLGYSCENRVTPLAQAA